MSRSLPTTLAARAHREDGQCLFLGKNPKSREVSNMACRNRKTSIIQKGGAGFKAAIDLNEEECIKEMSTQTK
jgi:hypothetical protein